jgi:hypothetical protein
MTIQFTNKGVFQFSKAPIHYVHTQPHRLGVFFVTGRRGHDNAFQVQSLSVTSPGKCRLLCSRDPGTRLYRHVSRWGKVTFFVGLADQLSASSGSIIGQFLGLKPHPTISGLYEVW